MCVCDITAKTVRKLKWWNRIAGVVAKRKTSQKRNLFLRVFNMHFWNPTAIKQGSQWKWSAKRHHHDINMWQTPSFQQDENHNKHENWWKRWADFRAVRKFKLSTCWIFSLLHPTHLAYQVVDGPNVVQHLVEVVESGRNDRKNISDRNRKRYTQDHPQKNSCRTDETSKHWELNWSEDIRPQSFGSFISKPLASHPTMWGPRVRKVGL